LSLLDCLAFIYPNFGYIPAYFGAYCVVVSALNDCRIGIVTYNGLDRNLDYRKEETEETGAVDF